MNKQIEVYNLGGLPTAPIDSFLELQEDFKISDPDKLAKLQMLIITRGFKYAFKAWKDPDGKLWIIDAHQRRKALLALRKAGFEIPEIPYEPIFAENKKEAVEEIAAYNSEFAKKNPDTLLFKKYDISTDTLERFNLGYEVKTVDYSPSQSLFAQEHEATDIQEDSVDFTIPDEEDDNLFVKPGDACLKPGGSYYVFHADSEGENFRASLRKAGFKIAQCCVWVKNSMVMGRQDYQWQHEPCLYGWKPGASHKWYSDRKQTTTWFFDKPQRNAIHPTMKPIALMAYPVCNSSAHGDIVLDIFSGSGSTLMACQQVDRICHAMEIDPKYVVGTIHRFKAMFPEQPVKLYRDGVLLSVEETQNIMENGKRTTASE